MGIRKKLKEKLKEALQAVLPIIGLVLLLSFTIGLGLSNIAGTTLRDSFTDFKEIIIKLIEVVIIPLLPLHIFGIFLNMTVSGQVMRIITCLLYTSDAADE